MHSSERKIPSSKGAENELKMKMKLNPDHLQLGDS